MKILYSLFCHLKNLSKFMKVFNVKVLSTSKWRQAKIWRHWRSNDVNTKTFVGFEMCFWCKFSFFFFKYNLETQDFQFLHKAFQYLKTQKYYSPISFQFRRKWPKNRHIAFFFILQHNCYSKFVNSKNWKIDKTENW